MKINWLVKNPFYVYILSFSLVFILYQLGWSDLYPKLTIDLLIFFGFTFLFSIIIGFIIQLKGYVKYRPINPNLKKRALIFTIIICFGHLIEFIHAGGIPLVNLLLNHNVIEYSEYGIKTFHVFLIPFNSFAIIYIFHIFISSRKRSVFIYYLIVLLPSLLIINRGMFIIGITSSFFVYFMSHNKRIGLKLVFATMTVILTILYFFGVIGNIRSGARDPLYIPLQSEVSQSFLRSSIPIEYYWTYLYGASPIANFQNTVNKTSFSQFDFQRFITFELFPDVISKRISNVIDKEPIGVLKITPWLTAGTIYAESYRYAHWFGPSILYLYLVFIVVFMIALVNNKSSYHVSVVSILLTIMFFNTFANMLVFAGLILQLFYPILFSLLERYSFRYGKN